MVSQNLKAGIDLGGSLTKIMIVKNNKIFKKFCFESNNNNKLDNFFLNLNINQFCITGGNKSYYPKKINSTTVVKKDEIQSITNGVLNVLKLNNFMICSIGTGTCLVDVNFKKGKHIGGTAIGGGTYKSLIYLLTNIKDFKKMDDLARKGNLSLVDFSVKDIVGSGIGILNSDITASNFGKVNFNSNIKKEDLILGVQNLIAESIFSTIFFASKYSNKKEIVFIGKMLDIPYIKKKLKKLCKDFKLNPYFPKNPAYITVLGAIK